MSIVVAVVVLVGGLTPVSAATPQTVIVAVRGMRYDPVALTVAQGTRVRWSNVTSPSRAHDVVSSFPGYFQSPLMVTGQSFRFTFSGAGTFTYVCSIHDVMIGSVVVPLRASLVTTGGAPHFLLTLGSAVLPPTSGYRYVLNWQAPGDTAWQVRTTRGTTMTVPATTPGTYRFRARVKDHVHQTKSANSPELTFEVPPAP